MTIVCIRKSSERTNKTCFPAQPSGNFNAQRNSNDMDMQTGKSIKDWPKMPFPSNKLTNLKLGLL